MLTLPTEVSDNKDLQGIEPILLVDFTDLAYYVASQEVTISSNSYNDLMKEGFSLSLRESFPEKINSIWSVSGLTLTLLDWQGSLRSNLVGSSPDLTNSTVKVYLKFGTATTVISNAVQIFTGTVTNYSIQRDVMTLEVKSSRPALADVPQNLIPLETTNAQPLQYGNFDKDPRLFGNDTVYYAIAPLEFYDGDEVAAKWIVADHDMFQMPTASELTDEDDAYAFVVRDNLYCHVKLDTSSGNITVTNTSSEASIKVSGTSEIEAHLFRPPTAEGAGNTVTAWANTIDGNSSTSGTVDDGETKLSVDTFLLDEVRESQFKSGAVSPASVQIRLGTVTGTNSFTARITDGTNTGSFTISSTDSDTWISFALPSAADSFDLIEENYRIEVEQDTGGETCEVHAILLRCQVQDVTESDPFLYVRCSGRKFGTTWNSRKTAGAAISYVPEVIESLLRHEWGYGDSDIDMDSFDDVNSYLSVTTLAVSAGTIYQQQDAYRLLRDICEINNLALIFSTEQKWRLVMPLKDVHDFSSSGTGTPGDEDIFTDSTTITDNEFDRHPILLGSFHLSRTDINNFGGKLTVKYVRTHQGFQKSETTGSGREIILNNWLLEDETAAEGLRDDLDNWLINQHFIAELETFSNAIAVEVGDIINIRHDDLNDDMLDATVNTQKWMVQEVVKNWRPHTIRIKAIELK